MLDRAEFKEGTESTTIGISVKIIRGSFSYERDLNQVRKFLLEIYKQTGMLHYLIPTKIENQKYGPCGPEYSSADDEAFNIWRLENQIDSDIIAVSHRGEVGNYHIEISPEFKHMEKKLLEELEKLEKEIIGERSGRVYMYTVDPDASRVKTLAEMGYEDYGLHEYNYHFPQKTEIPDNQVPEGFAIRGLEGEKDYAQFVEVIGSVYAHCRQHMTVEKMRFMTKAEFYHPDLNLVVVDHSGRFVAFCMCRLDPLTGIAEMEAVDARSDYGGLELEAALLSEALRRVMRHQPNLICAVEIDVSEPMNQVLEAAGFTRSVKMNMWGKMLEPL